MSIKQRLEDDLRQSVKSRDSERTSCLRMLKARLLEREVELRTRAGKKHTLASQIRDQRLAKRIARDLETVLGAAAGATSDTSPPLPGGAAI